MIWFIAAAIMFEARDPRAIIADMTAKREAFRECISTQIVRLGKGNNESAETIVRGVAAVCRQSENDLLAVYAETPFSSAEIAIAMQNDRKRAEDAGIAALLEARASKP